MPDLPVLPETLCPPCLVPEPDKTYLVPTKKVKVVKTDCFPSMIKNMTAAKACAVWPPACSTG